MCRCRFSPNSFLFFKQLGINIKLDSRQTILSRFFLIIPGVGHFITTDAGEQVSFEYEEASTSKVYKVVSDTGGATKVKELPPDSWNTRASQNEQEILRANWTAFFVKGGYAFWVGWRMLKIWFDTDELFQKRINDFAISRGLKGFGSLLEHVDKESEGLDREETFQCLKTVFDHQKDAFSKGENADAWKGLLEFIFSKTADATVNGTTATTPEEWETFKSLFLAAKGAGSAAGGVVGAVKAAKTLGLIKTAGAGLGTKGAIVAGGVSLAAAYAGYRAVMRAGEGDGPRPRAVGRAGGAGGGEEEGELMPQEPPQPTGWMDGLRRRRGGGA